MTIQSPAADCREPGCAGPSRRQLLGGMALGGLTTIVGTAAVTMSAGPAGAAGDSGSVLVVLSLRGAADGMSLVVPYGDPVYYEARPKIAIPRERLLEPDAFFGLHPALAPLVPLWKAGSLAAVHATGLPVANRSHFSAIEEVEDAQLGSATRSGWLNRLLGETPDPSPVAGISIKRAVPPTSLFGEVPTMSVSSYDAVAIRGTSTYDRRDRREVSLARMWRDESNPMGKAVSGAMQIAASFSAGGGESGQAGARYPGSDLGRAMSTVAETIRAGVGARLVTVDSGTWDMHAGIGGVGAGRMVKMAGDLAESVAAFFSDLGPHADRVTVVTVSEFGRRVQENSAQGLDHGWGNVMLVAGAGVRGGAHYGRWPGLQNSLDADLSVTTDYRSVLSEIVASRFPTASPSVVFPGFQREHVGVMEAR